MAAFSKRLTYAGKVYSFFGAFPSRAHAIGEGEQLEQGVGAKVVILPRGGQFGVYALVPRMKKNPRWPKGLTQAKARHILHEGVAKGKKLTEAQRRMFGARASGYPKKNPTPTDDLPQTLDIRGVTYQFVESFHSKNAVGGARDYIRVHNIQGAIVVSGLTHDKKPIFGVYHHPTKTKKNPPLQVFGLANPPHSAGELMSDSVHEVRYTHRRDGEPYKHAFKPGVRMRANDDGSITLYHPTKRIWEEFPE